MQSKLPYKFSSLIDTLEIKREPRRLLGRYFLAFETEAAAAGLTFGIVAPDKLMQLYFDTQHSWNGLTPVFDTRTTPAEEELSACLIGYDRNGVPAVAHACRIFDFGAKTLKTTLEDLTFWYGDRAHEHRETVVCSVACPSAEKITGRVLYIGAFWIRRDLRKIGIGEIVQELARCYGCSQWAFDHIVTVGSHAFNDPRLQTRYGFEGYEAGFSIKRTDMSGFDGLLLWSSRRSQIDRLGSLVGDYEQSQVHLREAALNKYS
jgi:hypothetical protein